MTARAFAHPPIEFERAVCGLDTSPQSLEGARQAIEIAAPNAHALAVLVWNPAELIHAGIHRAEVARDVRARNEAALAAANERFPRLEPRLVEGEERSQLIAVAEEANADLIAVGSHGTSRAAGVLLGSVATAMIREAPCSVLVARKRRSAAPPRTIVHAADGSEGSLEAARAAAAIAARTGAAVLSVHVGEAEAGAAILEEAAEVISAVGAEAATRLEPGAAPAGLAAVADEAGASLIAVGARGVTGIKALGSVSERVAHEARCSVLIVRRSPAPGA